MTSRQAQKLFFALSVDSLPPEVAAQVKDHIDDCPDCQQEWVLVERTLLMLSTASQPVLPSDRSVSMWLSCQHQFDGSESRARASRVLKIGTPQTKRSQTKSQATQAQAKKSQTSSLGHVQSRNEAQRSDFLGG